MKTSWVVRELDLAGRRVSKMEVGREKVLPSVTCFYKQSSTEQAEPIGFAHCPQLLLLQCQSKGRDGMVYQTKNFYHLALCSLPTHRRCQRCGCEGSNFGVGKHVLENCAFH